MSVHPTNKAQAQPMRPARRRSEREIIEGSPAPLGASWHADEGAYNFALYSRHAVGVMLLIYSEKNPAKPVYQYRLDPRMNKTSHIWHCRVPADRIGDGTLYAYRVEGPRERGSAHRFDWHKVLLDPFATEVFFPPGYSRDACAGPGPTDGRAPLGVLPRPRSTDEWPARPRPWHTHDTIVYELHVRGFTMRPSSGVSPELRGTFAGLVEKIPYLTELGITVVELLPVHQADPQEGSYWGYMPLNFFAPHRQYAAGDPHEEFRRMVEAMHAAGIEVWIDVVYNHTAEGGESGPTYSFRGIDNLSYYLFDDANAYINDSGTGNTLRCGHPIVRTLISESLRYWIERTNVDGFRFDLASILTRTAEGRQGAIDPPLITEISALAYQSGVRLVAEAWDIASYQLGRSFPGEIWRQWNGMFRDDIRAFVKGDEGKVTALVVRLYGSDDQFPDQLSDTYRPYQSVNFITAHDGFCLYDLVAYNQKHNEANGQKNTDGTDYNLSWNSGWEGDVDAPADVLALRRRQIKNFIALLMLANGTPMFCAGDEFMNTQHGNNNPYNQDNDITWLDWSLLERNRDMFRFFRELIAFRKAHPSIGRSTFWREDVRWYGVGANADFTPKSRHLAYFLSGASLEDGDLYVMISSYWEPLLFTIQEWSAGWVRVLDTSLASPHDISISGQEVPVKSPRYRVAARSVVVLYRAPRTE